jgi:hypothetical protein
MKPNWLQFHLSNAAIKPKKNMESTETAGSAHLGGRERRLHGHGPDGGPRGHRRGPSPALPLPGGRSSVHNIAPPPPVYLLQAEEPLHRGRGRRPLGWCLGGRRRDRGAHDIAHGETRVGRRQRDHGLRGGGAALDPDRRRHGVPGA